MTYFNRRFELRHIKQMRYWALNDVLKQKYHMHQVEADTLASFLLPMLRLNPEERATAHDLLSHAWLQGLPSPEAIANDAKSSSNAQVLPTPGQPGEDRRQLAQDEHGAPLQFQSHRPADTE